MLARRRRGQQRHDGMHEHGVHPATFVAFKRWLANQAEREALKRRRDVLQADAVEALLEQYLPLV